MKRLCFLLPERREEFVNSLTSYSKLQPRPVGPPETTVVSRTSRGFLSFFPGLPLLRAPPPQTPFRPLPAGRGTAKRSSPRAEEVVEFWPSRSAEEPSLPSGSRFSNMSSFPNVKPRVTSPSERYPRDVPMPGFIPEAVLLTVVTPDHSCESGFPANSCPCLTLSQKPTP